MLNDPLVLGNGVTLRNRLGKAAMSEGLADMRGQATSELEALYRSFSDGGAGLLITGNMMIEPASLERPGNMILFDDAALPSFTRFTAAAKGTGTVVLAQLSHPGRQVQRMVNPHPVAPSEGAAVQFLREFARPRALTEAEIRELVARFARSARLCEQAGFSGVEIHGAHGYLVNQFLSPLTNRRTDAWGGPLENRARFLLEVVRAVRAATGPSFVLAVKLNSADFQRGGFESDDSLKVISMLERERVELLEISGGNYEAPQMMATRDAPSSSTLAREAYFLDFARQARALTKMKLMVTGGFRSRSVMESALESGALDVIGMGRPIALEPDLPKRLLDGSAEQARFTPKRFWIRKFESLADTAYAWWQMNRVAHGQQPEAGVSRTRALVTYYLDIRRKVGQRRALGVAPAPPVLPEGAA